jgi:hypothetical protein
MLFCQAKSENEKSALCRRGIDLLFVVLLLGLNLLVYWRSLSGYFLADDFVHVAYLQRVFAGHPEMLLQNFWTNWMQTEGTQFYRPFISLTLALDWLFWKANALGFHLTNILYQVGSTIFLFLLSRRLLREFGDWQATLCAFLAAALFAVHPLHPEVVSWIIGRVDSVCTCFSLAAFWLFLKGQQEKNRLAYGVAIVCFVVSLISKEMAITLPPLLFLWCLFAPKDEAQVRESNAVLERLRQAWARTWPFWLTLGLYLIVRTLSLGTIAGGYTGSVGEGLSGSLWKRFFEDGGMLRVLFPFDIEVFSPFDHLRRYLKTIYIVCAASVVVRLLWLRADSGLSRWIIFAFGWLVLSLIPTYQVWNLTDNLLGSRFMYMSTAPLCLLIGLLVFPLVKAVNRETLDQSRFKLIQRACALTLVVLVLCYATIAYKNNLTWVHAGQEVRDLREALEAKLSSLPEPKKLVLMNLPQRIGGAHQIYNAAMLWVLMQWPLCVNNLSSRILTFEPMMYGDSELVNIARLRNLLKSAQNYDIYVWDSQTRRLVALNLAGAEKLSREIKLPGFSVVSLGADQFLASPPIDISSMATDFVDLDLSATLPSQAKNIPPYIFLSWTSAQKPLFDGTRRLALPATLDGKNHKYRFAVSQHKNWALTERVNLVRLDLPTPLADVQLNGMTFLSGEKLIPQLFADENYLREDADGVSRLTKEKAVFEYDASQIDGADSFVVEVSKPNSWFEHYSGQMRDQELSKHALTRIVLKESKGKFEIQSRVFPMPAYYQVRLACLNKQGEVIGFVSDSINLQVSEFAGKKRLSGKAKIKRYAI